jgi:hypothetical protein
MILSLYYHRHNPTIASVLVLPVLLPQQHGHQEQPQNPFRTLLSSVAPYLGLSIDRNTRMSLFATKHNRNIDIDQCFIQLERYMLDVKKVVGKASDDSRDDSDDDDANASYRHHPHPSWDELDMVTVVLHRNGQAESCGTSQNTSSSHSDSNSEAASSTDTSTSAQSQSPSPRLATIFQKALYELYELDGQSCPDFSNKYHVEAFLTRVLVHWLVPPSTCHSQEEPKAQGTALGNLYDYCDMGIEHTPILLDHEKLISNTVPMTSSISSSSSTTLPKQYVSRLPCHLHTEHGLRVTSLQQLRKLLVQAATLSSSSQSQDDHDSNETKTADTTDCTVAPNGENICSTSTTTTQSSTSGSVATVPPEFHLYAVPAGRVFMHVAAYIGQIIELQHVPGADPNQMVYLKVLSVSPAVFDLYNFFTKSESATLVQRALSETKESHRIKRSTTGTGEHHVNTRRTSESGFDTDGATAILIKQLRSRFF